jgi:hypothetical protein
VIEEAKKSVLICPSTYSESGNAVFVAQYCRNVGVCLVATRRVVNPRIPLGAGIWHDLEIHASFTLENLLAKRYFMY